MDTLLCVEMDWIHVLCPMESRLEGMFLSGLFVIVVFVACVLQAWLHPSHSSLLEAPLVMLVEPLAAFHRQQQLSAASQHFLLLQLVEQEQAMGQQQQRRQ